MSTDPKVREIAYQRAPLGQRAKPALVLTIGEVKAGANHPTKLDYFRPKPGEYAQRFLDAFGATPHEIQIAIPDDLPAVLDIRWKAYGKSESGNHYLKALGQSNYVERAIDGDLQAMNAPETLTVWRKDGKKGEATVDGPDDPFLAQLGAKVYTTFRFWVPDVLGLGSWAEIATTSEVSTHNLYRALSQQWQMLRGRWIGLPLVLYLQESKARPVVNGQRISSKFWALAVRTPLSVSEFVEQQAALASIQTRAALPPVAHEDAARDHEISPGLFETGGGMRRELEQLPAPADEGLRTRQEASAADVADDTTMNRIATLRVELGQAADELLVGAYGVDDPAKLSALEARAYVAGLERIREARESRSVEEIALEGDYEEPAAAPVIEEFEL